jgi:hypothetical protein
LNGLLTQDNASDLEFFRGTGFGSPVVPDVNMYMRVSLSPAHFSSMGDAEVAAIPSLTCTVLAANSGNLELTGS